MRVVRSWRRSREEFCLTSRGSAAKKKKRQQQQHQCYSRRLRRLGRGKKSVLIFWKPTQRRLQSFEWNGSPPRSSKITVTKERKGEKERARRRKGGEEKKSNGCTLSFYNHYLGDSFGQNTVGRKKVHLAITFSKIWPIFIATKGRLKIISDGMYNACWICHITTCQFHQRLNYHAPKFLNMSRNS